MKKVLVTGSNGYIGHNLVKQLQLKGHYVVGLDGRDCIMNIGDEFIHQNILDTNQIEGDFDTVIHLAALVQVGMGEKAMMDYYRTNVVGTMNILERVDYKNFIFASTCQAEMLNVYGSTKRMAEYIIRQYCERNSKSYSIFRFGNVIGGQNLTNTDGLMYNLIKAKETGVFELYGNDYNTFDGTALRDYVHVYEVCHALTLAVDRPSCVPGAEVQPSGEYLGRAMPVSVMDCIEAFKKANDCDFEVVVKPRRQGDVGTVPVHTVSPYMPLNIYTLEEMMRV
jgi:UDP-glucose 4-epimerase